MSQTQQRLSTEHGGRRFRIVHDAAAGFYLYVYDGAPYTHDYLQDTLDQAREFAREKFGVPVQSWLHEHTTASHAVDLNMRRNSLTRAFPLARAIAIFFMLLFLIVPASDGG